MSSATTTPQRRTSSAVARHVKPPEEEEDSSSPAAVREELAQMALQLQAASKALAARIADVDRKEGDLERRRLAIAQRHEEQLVDLEGKSRRLAAEMQLQVEIEVEKRKQAEAAAQDAVQRLAAVQRDYDLLQSAMLRVQSKEAERFETERKSADQVRQLQASIEELQQTRRGLEEQNAALAEQATKSTEAMRHYRTEYRAAVDRHAALSNYVRRQEASQLEADRRRLEEDKKTAEYQRIIAASSPRTPHAGVYHDCHRGGDENARPWAHDFVLHAGAGGTSKNPSGHYPASRGGDASAAGELGQLVAKLADDLQRDERAEVRRQQRARRTRSQQQQQRIAGERDRREDMEFADRARRAAGNTHRRSARAGASGGVSVGFSPTTPSTSRPVTASGPAWVGQSVSSVTDGTPTKHSWRGENSKAGIDSDDTTDPDDFEVRTVDQSVRHSHHHHHQQQQRRAPGDAGRGDDERGWEGNHDGTTTGPLHPSAALSPATGGLRASLDLNVSADSSSRTSLSPSSRGGPLEAQHRDGGGGTTVSASTSYPSRGTTSQGRAGTSSIGRTETAPSGGGAATTRLSGGSTASSYSYVSFNDTFED